MDQPSFLKHTKGRNLVWIQKAGQGTGNRTEILNYHQQVCRLSSLLKRPVVTITRNSLQGKHPCPSLKWHGQEHTHSEMTQIKSQ